MIDELDETIREMLKAEIPIKNGEIDIAFDQPKREWSSRLTRPTINFFLYDLRENVTLRQHQWERIPNGKPGDNQATKKRTPFRADCYYMVTIWASDPLDEHLLLSRTLMALFRFPILPPNRLVGSLKNQAYDIQARLAVPDRLTNPAEVWSALDNEIRPSVPYIVTLALDPWAEVSGPAVRSFSLGFGQTITLPWERQIVEGGQSSMRVYIGGVVRGGGKDGEPLKDIQVAIKGTGFMDTTDELGRFRFGGLAPGEYTLVAWPPEGKPREKQVSVPTTGINYDLEI